MTNEEHILKMATTTVYTADEITKLMAYTGIGIERTEKMIADFSRAGICSLKDINTIAKMGRFDSL